MNFPAGVSPRLHNGTRLVAGGMIAIAAAWPWLPHPPSVCPLRTATGIPCPFCGVTRSVAAAAHGQLMTSLRFHPLGIAILLAAIALLVRPSLLTAWRRPPPTWLLAGSMTVLAVYNVGFNPTFN